MSVAVQLPVAAALVLARVDAAIVKRVGLVPSGGCVEWVRIEGAQCTHPSPSRECGTICSDDSKPYMILVALIKGFQKHEGLAIIRARGEGWRARNIHRTVY